VAPQFFERLYEQADDPWDFDASPYERRKYLHTLDSLGRERFTSALEIGCSIGVLTAQLAERSGRVVGIDVSDRALALARARLRNRPNVRLERGEFPEQVPPGPWDLVVCSEVLYYLDEAPFALAIDRLEQVLGDGATVMAVHWRPSTETYPLRGDEVHDRLSERLARWHELDARRPLYRLDRFGSPQG